MFTSSEMSTWEVENSQNLSFRFYPLRDRVASPSIARLNEFLT